MHKRVGKCFPTYRKKTTGHTDSRPGADPITQHGSLSFRKEHGMTRSTAIV